MFLNTAHLLALLCFATLPAIDEIYQDILCVALPLLSTTTNANNQRPPPITKIQGPLNINKNNAPCLQPCATGLPPTHAPDIPRITYPTLVTKVCQENRRSRSNSQTQEKISRYQNPYSNSHAKQSNQINLTETYEN